MIKKNNKIIHQHNRANFFLIILLAIGIAIELYIYYFAHKGESQATIRSYAARIVQRCENVSSRPACYDEEIPRLMNPPTRLSMEDAFRLAKLVQEKDREYLYCHILGHKISYKETSKDLSKWKDVVARCPTTFCNNGCQHGAIMRRFNSETLTPAQVEAIKPDLSEVCEPRGSWKPKEIERSMCYHSLGHLAMFVTRASVARSVALCIDIAKKTDGRDNVQTCTEGVLMTVFQSLEPEDKALVKDITPTKATVISFCNGFSGMTRSACFRESWPLYRDELRNPAGLVRFCSYGDLSQLETCVGTVINAIVPDMVISRGEDLSMLEQYCRQLPDRFLSLCFSHSARWLIQIDPRYEKLSRDVCVIAERYDVADDCYKRLNSMADMTYGASSEAYAQYCDALPTRWKEACVRKQDVH